MRQEKKNFKKFSLSVKFMAFLSFFIGILSVAIFFLGSKYFTLQSSLSEHLLAAFNSFLIVMVLFGLLAFVVFVFSILIIIWRAIGVWLMVVVFFPIFILVLMSLFLGGFYLDEDSKNISYPSSSSSFTYTPQPAKDSSSGTSKPLVVTGFTGQELLMAVNHHRNINGIPELPVDNRLCNNLAQRYLDIKMGLDEGVAHAKFEEWVNKNVGEGVVVGEIFTGPVKNPQEAIDSWMGSPGHRSALLDASYTGICSYAANGYAIVVFSKPL